MKIFDELKRRKVGKVAISYAIIGWIILQVSSVVAPALNLPDWAITFTLYLLVVGFPISVAAAWIYDVTPDGVVRDEIDVSNQASLTKPILIGILIALVGALGVWNYTNDEQKRTLFAFDPTPSIAVLPFQNFSSDPEQDYFVDGLSEEILNFLAKSQNLRVIARTSSFAYRGQNKDMRDIGSELGVNHLLEGSVRKSGNQIRVTAQLIRVDDGSHIWSETYDREFIDVFSIQEDISGNIAQIINSYLITTNDAVDRPQPIIPASEDLLIGTTTQVAEAQEAYLRGLYLYNSAVQNLEQSELKEAIESLIAAIEYDENYASAWIALANAYTKAASFTFGYIPRLEGLNLGSAAAFKAIEINPNLSGAWQALGEANMGWNEPMARYSFREAFEKAIELNPNDASSLASLAFGIRSTDKKAFSDLTKRALSLDPLGRNTRTNYALMLTYQGQFESADAFIRTWDDGEAVSPFALNYLSLNAFLGNDIETLLEIGQNLKANDEPGLSWIRNQITEAYLTLGMHDEAIEWSEPQSDYIISYANRDYDAAYRRTDELDRLEPTELRNANLLDFFVNHAFRIHLAIPNYDLVFLAQEIDDHREGIHGSFLANLMAATNYRYRHVGLLETKEAWLFNQSQNFEAARAAAQSGLDIIARLRDVEFNRPDYYYEEARLYAQIGDLDAAIAAFNDAINKGFKSWEIKVDPLLSPLRSDDRFLESLARYNANIEALAEKIKAREID